MTDKQVAIIGGGLSGLYTAYLLEQHGITDYVILEARSRIGGRITELAVESSQGIDRFELGPSWFWPELQLQLDALISQLSLKRFAQYEQGQTLVEQSIEQAPIAVAGYVNSPTSMRLEGGMGALVKAIEHRLAHKDICYGAVVKRIIANDSTVNVDYRSSSDNQSYRLEVEQVVLALPPRLVAEQIHFEPSLPITLKEQWQNAPTWMAPHAKYIAVFDDAFWRAKGLSGSARSAIGPMVEIHDASTENSQAAIFGFIGVSALDRRSISQEDLKKACRAQLIRLFGEEARGMVTDTIQDWAQEPFTATKQDLTWSQETHKTVDAYTNEGVWQNRLIGAGSEFSPQYPGYIAGAIEASELGVAKLLTNLTAKEME